VFALAVVAIVLRKPDAVFHAQFYIEDGDHWYANAHEHGLLSALTVTHRGYYVLVQAVGGALAALFPLAQAPLVMALYGIAIDALPAVVVASSRFAAAVPSRSLRLFLAFVVVAAPNAWTNMGSTTNAMWYLALAACLVIAATPPATRAWKVFDVAVVTMSGLSGPFAIMLAPVAAVKWRLRREGWTLTLLIVTVVAALVQAASVLLSPRGDPMAYGGDAVTVGEIFVKRVVYEALFGQVGGYAIMTGAWPAFWSHPATLAAAGLAGVAIIAYALVRGPLELKLLMLFAGLILAATLVYAGDAKPGEQWWPILMSASNGNRYFLIPAIAFLFVCVWLATRKPLAVRTTGIALVAVAIVLGIRLDWREPPYPDFEFAAAVRNYQAARPGEKVVIMTLPDRFMTLTKKAGEGVVDEPEACEGELAVAPALVTSNQIAWTGSVARSEGGDPYAVYALPVRRFVCGVRVRFAIGNPQREFLMLQMFWSDSRSKDSGPGRFASSHLVRTGASPQSAVFHVGDTIDRIRLDPGSEPGTSFELKDVVLLTRRNDS
jgi:hypothetical protein